MLNSRGYESTMPKAHSEKFCVLHFFLWKFIIFLTFKVREGRRPEASADSENSAANIVEVMLMVQVSFWTWIRSFSYLWGPPSLVLVLTYITLKIACPISSRLLKWTEGTIIGFFWYSVTSWMGKTVWGNAYKIWTWKFWPIQLLA